MHSTLQTWAIEVVPEARATVISLFAAALFAGTGWPPPLRHLWQTRGVSGCSLRRRPW